MNLLNVINRTTRLLSALTRFVGSGATQVLTDAATIAYDADLGVNASVTLGGNRTLANPTNLRAGMRGSVVVTQDGTGNRTLAYGSKWLFPGNSHTLTTTAAGVDIIDWYYDATADKIYARLEKALA